MTTPLVTALDRLIRAVRLRRDIEAYRRIPPTREEIDLAAAAALPDLDDTDWEALHPESNG